MKSRILLFLLSLAFTTTLFANPLPEEGKTIFSSRCAGCHNVNKQLTGPALAGVGDRRSIDWIIKFVQSSQSVIKSGDKDAVALFQQFNHIPMPDHTDLTGDDIKNIVAYVKSATVTAASTAEVPFSRPSSLKPNFQPLTIHDYGFFLSFLGLAALLIMTLLLFVRVKEIERKTKELDEIK